eukprot:2217088-Amphidinium_carterae.1
MELARCEGGHSGFLMLDLRKAYEQIDWKVLAVEGLLAGIPQRIMFGVLRLYGMTRVVQWQQQVGEACQPWNG